MKFHITTRETYRVVELGEVGFQVMVTSRELILMNTIEVVFQYYLAI